MRNEAFSLLISTKTLKNTSRYTYQVSRIMHETHASALFLTLTRIIKMISSIIHCVAFGVDINSKIQRLMKSVAMTLFVGIHFRFKLDINANFTMKNSE